MTSFVLRALSAAVVLLAATVNASAQQIALPSGKSINCSQAKKYLSDAYGPGSDLLLPKSAADAQGRRAAILAETTKHIAAMKKDWDKKSAEQKKKMRDNLYWFVGSVAISQGAQRLLKATSLSEIDKKYAEVALDKSQKSAELVAKAGFQKEITVEEVAVMPAGSIITILSAAGKIAGWWGLVLDGGLFGIDMAALYGDTYLTDKDFKGQIEELEKLANLLANRLTDTNEAAFAAFKKKVTETCGGATPVPAPR